MREAQEPHSSLGGLTVLPARAGALVRALQARSGATAGQLSAVAEDLVQQSRANRAAVTALVRYELDRALGRIGLASTEDLEALTARVRALEEAVGTRSATPPPAARARKDARRSPSAPAQTDGAPS